HSPSASGTSFGATEGQTFSGFIGSYQNPDQPARAGSGNSVQINWGDGSSSAGSLTLVSAGNYQVSGSHAYQEEGNYTLTFTVTAAGGTSSVQASTSVHINDAPLTMVGMSPPAVVLVGQAMNNITVATFTDANPFHSTGDYSAQIAWGDGTVTAGAIRDN